MAQFAHRGRIQAQGKALEKSVKWAQDTPLTLSDGLRLLDTLVARLTTREQVEREEGIERQRLRMKRIAAVGGIDHPQSWSEPPASEIRIDIEVWMGRAFIPD